MPQNIGAPIIHGVMPAHLAIAFNEQIRWEAVVNQDYADGSSDRAPLVTIPRRFFRINTKLRPTQWKALRDWYWSHIGEAFYFYFGRETQPPYTIDSTGAATTGRYTVVFDGAYSENFAPGVTKLDTYGIGQSQTSFQLREIA